MPFELHLLTEGRSPDLGPFVGERRHHQRYCEDWGEISYGYRNPDTGVQFSLFPYEDTSFVRFHTNGFRPEAEGEETLVEVVALVEHLRARIAGPDASTTADGRFTETGFRAAWRAANARSYREVLARDGGPEVVGALVIREEAATNARIWRWNAGRGSDPVRVRIERAKSLSDGSTVRFGVWREGTRVVVPDLLTHVMLERPRPWWRLRGTGPERHLVPRGLLRGRAIEAGGEPRAAWTTRSSIRARAICAAWVHNSAGPSSVLDFPRALLD